MNRIRRAGAIVWPAIVWLALWSCAAQSQTLVNPRTGATTKCSASGIGLGTGWARTFIEDCITRSRDLGYVPLDELTPEQRRELQKDGGLPLD